MRSRDGRFTVVFNGEIYNAPELRKRLYSEGISLRGTSDTEVLLESWALSGRSILPELEGMFAFAIWDNDASELCLVRDTLGIKPLFVCADGYKVWFSSSYRSLLDAEVSSSDASLAAEAGYFLWGSVPEPLTPRLDITQLKSGEWRSYQRDGRVLSGHFGDLASNYQRNVRNEQAVADEIATSVKKHLLSDVPVGLLLSSGLDSAVLLDQMARNLGRVETVTLSFPDQSSDNDESELATEIAALCGARHTTIEIGAAEFRASVSQFMSDMDMPTIDGLNSWLACRAAAQLGLKVVVSGVGGDELFGGYRSFRDVPMWVTRFGPVSRALEWMHPRRLVSLSGLDSIVSRKARALLGYAGNLSSAYFLRRCTFLPEELPEVMGEERARVGLDDLEAMRLMYPVRDPTLDPLAQISLWETTRFQRNQLLRDSDWSSMSHGVEMRLPFVDTRLHSRVAGNFRNGLLGKEHWYRRSLSEPMRQRVYGRQKRGFSTGIQQWLENSEALSQWRGVEALKHQRTTWTKRQAYSVWHSARWT